MTDGRATANAKKESFWSDVFMKVGCVPQDEMVVVADDMNGHVGNSNLGYSGIHGGFGYGYRLSLIHI